jgi:uridine kinase
VSSTSTPVTVGVAGGSASGKSTVVAELVRRLGGTRAAVLRHDAYYHDLSHLPFEERIEVNVDHPDSLETELLVGHVRALMTGEPVAMPDYDFVTQTRGPDGIVVRPASVVIVEGLFTLQDERLRALWDVAVFVATTEDERLQRRIERDGRERGRDRAAVVSQHERVVQPMHDRFVEPSRAFADVVLEGGGHNLAAIERLAARIRAMHRV